MLKQTIQLFIKALVIGVLINMSLQQVAGASLKTDESTGRYQNQQLLKQIPASSDLYFSDQAGD
jgi:hypothetical protein